MGDDALLGPVTVLFTDVAGSTDLRSRLGDEAANDVLRAHEALVRAEVERHGGREVKALGDGLMVAFASTRKAIACAVAIQRASEARNRVRHEEEVRVRIGLNTGEVEREDGDLYGAAVNAAARIAAKAEPGGVLVSEVTKQLAGAVPDVSFADRGRHRLKGFPDRWRLFEVSWRREPEGPRVPQRTPFVGREAEWAELAALLDKALSGEGSFALVGGEPGVGKSRLADELAREAVRRGALALTGRCYEAEGSPPYIPFVEILEGALAGAARPEAIREALGDAAGEVARIVPEIRRAFPDAPQPLELPPEQARRYLFSSIRDFLDRAARIRPQVLVLDDLHWADEPTTLLLHHIAERLCDMRVMVVGTYRDVELDVGRPFAAALEELVRRRLARRLSLKRLPEEDVASMLRGLSGQDPPAPMLEAVFRETEGNPFFVEEVFRHLTEEGKLFDDEGRLRRAISIADLDVPESVRLVVGRRLRRLGETAERALAAAAVIGPSFDYPLLEGLGEVEPDALLDVFDAAQRGRLIVPMPDGGEDRFSFAHELVRQTLLTGVSAPRRRRLHLRIAELMERLYADAPGQRAADVARHLLEAGSAADPARTVRYLTLAGDRAIEAAAFEDALRHVENALSIVPPGDAPGRAELLFRLGLAQRSLGHVDDAIVAWRESLRLFEQVGDEEAIGRVCMPMASHLIWAGRWPEALEFAGHALQVLPERPSVPRGRMLAAAGLVFSLGGYHDAADSMLRQALAMAEELGDERLLGYARWVMAIHDSSYWRPGSVLEGARRAAEHLRAAGATWDLAGCLNWELLPLMLTGRFEEAREAARAQRDLAERIGHQSVLFLERLAENVLEHVVVPAPDLEAFEAAAREAVELGRRADVVNKSQAYLQLGCAQFELGRWDEAIETLREAVSHELEGAFRHLEVGFLLIALAHAGRRDEALALLEGRRGALPEPGQPAPTGAANYLLCLPEALLALGEYSEAARLYPMVVAMLPAGSILRSGDGRLVETIAGVAASAAGDLEAAERHFRAALEIAERLPSPIERAHVLRFWGEALARAGTERDRARDMLADALGAYRRFGMPRHAEMAGAAVARL